MKEFRIDNLYNYTGEVKKLVVKLLIEKTKDIGYQIKDSVPVGTCTSFICHEDGTANFISIEFSSQNKEKVITIDDFLNYDKNDVSEVEHYFVNLGDYKPIERKFLIEGLTRQFNEIINFTNIDSSLNSYLIYRRTTNTVFLDYRLPSDSISMSYADLYDKLEKRSHKGNKKC